MRELESISRRIVQGFTKFDVFFKGFLTVFADFLELAMFGRKTESWNR